ncbi:hypothetical protein [Alkaliphilus peptidifermentans]|uniref:Uncharacterized protein n=1 Tax=Alkaliphilus peptidifermentans DSM 18978 TaxID=1120976 RepID=A0A1G5GZQ7_9FIRM|nr:hypothetical protein [Alkaliphilus peptidifermentans]SCY56600.1 hypothetical protein SAMN03080606_01836 [Alkaliphilus peptidifermentans DSM 18978]
MEKRKKLALIIGIILLLITGYGLTYIPRSIINIKSTEVTKLTVFNGNSGSQIEITNRTDIDYIINNLNDVQFQKGKVAIGYMGYSFNTTIYDKKGKSIKNLIINSEKTIRYKGFFYEAKTNLIDYHYIENLFITN